MEKSRATLHTKARGIDPVKTGITLSRSPIILYKKTRCFLSLVAFEALLLFRLCFVQFLSKRQPRFSPGVGSLFPVNTNNDVFCCFFDIDKKYSIIYNKDQRASLNR